MFFRWFFAFLLFCVLKYIMLYYFYSLVQTSPLYVCTSERGLTLYKIKIAWHVHISLSHNITNTKNKLTKKAIELLLSFVTLLANTVVANNLTSLPISPHRWLFITLHPVFLNELIIMHIVVRKGSCSLGLLCVSFIHNQAITDCVVELRVFSFSSPSIPPLSLFLVTDITYTHILYTCMSLASP